MSVGDYLASYGVPRDRLRTEGRGEREPRRQRDRAGRQLNRRVEIFVKPIVEGQGRRPTSRRATDAVRPSPAHGGGRWPRFSRRCSHLVHQLTQPDHRMLDARIQG